MEVREAFFVGRLGVQRRAGLAVDDQRDFGRDALVTINGQQATANGTEARVVTGGFDVFVDIDGASAWTSPAGTALTARFLEPIPVTVLIVLGTPARRAAWPRYERSASWTPYNTRPLIPSGLKGSA